MAGPRLLRTGIGLLNRYSRPHHVTLQPHARCFSDFWENERRTYENKWRSSQLWDRRTWNMTSDRCIFWRKNPSSTEAHLVLATWMIAGTTIWIFILKYYDWTPEPPEHPEDLEHLVDDEPGAKLTLPGAAKASDSHYWKLLYKNDIRIMVLHPGDFEDEIQFHMEHIRLHTPHPKYEALSYAWEGQIATEAIWCSDRKIHVTANVHSALRHLRDQNYSRKLWIDALCIDQSDIDERSQQVRLMGDVFSEADRVVVWLGNETADTHTALSSIQDLYKDIYSYGLESSILKYIPWSKNNTDRVLKRSILNSDFEEATKPNLHDLDWDAIGNLVRRDWFHRLWVVQEASHAKRAIVVCGNLDISWTILSEVLTFLVDHDLTSKYLNRHCAYACNVVVNIKKMREQKTRDDLFTVVLDNLYGGCSDPRDKIFAMMSLSEGRDAFDWEISFDYSLSVTELFEHFAIWDVIRYRSLRSLSCATTGPKDFRVPPPLPSWVPDWTRLLEQNLLVRCKATSKFAAALKTETDVWFTHDKSRMHVRGAVVDYVKTIGSVPSFIKSTSVFEIDKQVIGELANMTAWIHECWEIAKDGHPMTTSNYEGFWRTMLCGLTSNGYPAPRAYSKHFLQYLKYMREAPLTLEYYLDHPEPVAACRLSVFSKILVQLGFSKSSYCSSETDGHSWSFHQWFNERFKTNSLVEESLQTWGTRKRFCRTWDGRLARVPENAAVGDSICILHGSDIPYVLRLQEDGSFTVVGECYVHGIMHGEALEHPLYEPATLRIQ